MKITYSSEKINSFGGINFADHIIGNSSVYTTIDQTLGPRGIKAEYSYSDLFRSYLLMVLCGGECAEDITEHLRGELAHVKGLKCARLTLCSGCRKNWPQKKKQPYQKLALSMISISI